MKQLALLATLAAMTCCARAEGPRWQLVGVEPERAEISWNKDDFQRLQGGDFEVTVKWQFFRPVPIPGSNSLPPATTSFTRYEINCDTGYLQPIRAQFLNAAGDLIGRIDTRGPLQRAEPSGGKTRDRIFDSFCTAMKKSPGPQRLP